MSTLDDPFIGALVQAIESAAHDQGFVVILASSSDAPEREVAAARMLQSRRVDGVIAASSRVGALYRGRLGQPSVPVVLINSLAAPGDRDLFSVGVDNRHGGHLATQHLVSRGHRRIAYVASPPDRGDNRERLSGYRQALAEAGIGFDESLVVQGTGDSEGGRKVLPLLLSLEPRPGAAFCYNDMTAIGMIDAARTAGLSLPGDLALVGFDDIVFSQFCHPPLTTIAQPVEAMGRAAIDLMRALLSDEGRGGLPGPNLALQGALKVRASSG